MRPDWDEYFLRLAYLTAGRSTCPRKHVGAILVDSQQRIVSTGYNGAPQGVDHCEDVGCLLVQFDGKESCVRTLHAESNALDFAGRQADGCVLYVTVTPCFDCAKRIMNSGIWKVVYHQHYESRYGKSGSVVKLLEDSYIEVEKYNSRSLDMFVAGLEALENLNEQDESEDYQH